MAAGRPETPPSRRDVPLKWENQPKRSFDMPGSLFHIPFDHFKTWESKRQGQRDVPPKGRPRPQIHERHSKRWRHQTASLSNGAFSHLPVIVVPVRGENAQFLVKGAGGPFQSTVIAAVLLERGALIALPSAAVCTFPSPEPFICGVGVHFQLLPRLTFYLAFCASTCGKDRVQKEILFKSAQATPLLTMWTTQTSSLTRQIQKKQSKWRAH